MASDLKSEDSKGSVSSNLTASSKQRSNLPLTKGQHTRFISDERLHETVLIKNNAPVVKLVETPA